MTPETRERLALCLQRLAVFANELTELAESVTDDARAVAAIRESLESLEQVAVGLLRLMRDDCRRSGRRGQSTV